MAKIIHFRFHISVEEKKFGKNDSLVTVQVDAVWTELRVW